MHTILHETKPPGHFLSHSAEDFPFQIPKKKSSDRQALSIFHIEESLYLHYNEDSISPPNQASCCIKPSIMLALNLSSCAPTETPHFRHPHLLTILSSSFISHSNVCTFLSRKKKKKKNLPLTPIPYGNSSKEMLKRFEPLIL